MPAGWAPAASEESIDLAKQLVKLTDVIVQLVSAHRDGQDVADERARARSPDLDPADTAAAPIALSRFESHELRDARAGPAPPDHPTLPFPELQEIVRSASLTAGAVPRPEPVAEVVAPVVDEPVELVEAVMVDPDPEPDPRVAMMERLMELDRQRRRLREWMDAEDSGDVIEPPIEVRVGRYLAALEEAEVPDDADDSDDNGDER